MSETFPVILISKSNKFGTTYFHRSCKFYKSLKESNFNINHFNVCENKNGKFLICDKNENRSRCPVIFIGQYVIINPALDRNIALEIIRGCRIERIE